MTSSSYGTPRNSWLGGGGGACSTIRNSAIWLSALNGGFCASNS